jgi:ribosomal protein S10
MLKENKIRYGVSIIVKAFFLSYLKRDLNLIKLFQKKNKVRVNVKKIYLPLRIKKFSVVRSPFVSKLSKEQYEVRIYRVVCLFETTIFYLYKAMIQTSPRFSYFSKRYKWF